MDGHLLAMSEYTLEMIPSEARSPTCSIWIQLHGLAENWVTERKIAKQASEIGTATSMDLKDHMCEYMRLASVRVPLDLEKPLQPTIWVRREGLCPPWVDVRFEKLPFICFLCGRIGHSNKHALR